VIDHPALPFLKRDEKAKVVSAADAVKIAIAMCRRG